MIPELDMRYLVKRIWMPCSWIYKLYTNGQPTITCNLTKKILSSSSRELWRPVDLCLHITHLILVLISSSKPTFVTWALITMSSDALFAQPIAEKVTSTKFKIGWVLHTFQTRDKKPMMALWKSLILCEHDYCCHISAATGINAVWHPRRGGGGVSTKSSERVQNIRRAYFAIHGPRIFNSLPKYVHNTSKCDLNTFKSKLDYFLRQVPDQPLIPNYTAQRLCCTNSLIDWSQMPNWRSPHQMWLSTVASANRAGTYPK